VTRPPRPAFAGATYHVVARGNNSSDVFTDDYDRYAYLALLAKAIRAQELRLFAYALMTTHLHLVLQTTTPNISRTIHVIHSPYAHAFNRRHGCRGHLFEGRFRSKLIDTDAYLLEATRYAHLNPVNAGAVKNPEDYAWSSYRAYIAPYSRTQQTLVEVWPVLELFSADPRVSRPAYVRFVLEGMNDSAVPGTDDF